MVDQTLRSQYARTTVRIPKSLYIKVKALTLVEDKTFEQILEEALSEYLERHKDEFNKLDEVIG